MTWKERIEADSGYGRILLNASIPKVILVVVCAAPVYIFLKLVIGRIGYPFDLEWIEGHMLAMATRVAHGLPLYPAPSLEYIPAPYFPLYFWITGALVKLFGPQFWTGRLVSALCVAASCALIFRIVRRRSGSAMAGAAAIAVFLATHEFVSDFYDLFRIDSLGLFLLILSFEFADDCEQNPFSGAAAGLALFAATLAKQNAVLFFPALAIPLLVRSRRQAVSFGAVYLLSTGLFCLIYSHATDGWFYRYTLDLVAGSPIKERYYLFHKWVFFHLPIPMAVIVAGIASRIVRKNWKILAGHVWLWFFLSSYAVSFLFRINAGGAKNSFIPLCAAAAVGAGVMLRDATDLFSTVLRNIRWMPLMRKPAAALWIFALLLSIQIAVQSPWIRRQVPTKSDHKRATAFLKMLDGLDGTYYMPGHVLPRDNTFWIHQMSWMDMGRSKWGRPIAARLAREMRDLKIDHIVSEAKSGFPPQLNWMLRFDYRQKTNLTKKFHLRMMCATPSAPGVLHARKTADIEEDL